MDKLFNLPADIVSEPFLLGLVLGLFTFILEDAATVGAAVFASGGHIPAWWGLTVIYCGIILGDMGLYFFGRFASYNRPARNFLQRRGVIAFRDKFRDNMFAAVFASRFIPGMRLTCYSACGFFKLPFGVFIMATACASCLWTSGLFFVVYFLGQWVLDEWGQWRWVIGGAIVIVVIVVPRIVHAKLKLHARVTK